MEIKVEVNLKIKKKIFQISLVIIIKISANKISYLIMIVPKISKKISKITDFSQVKIRKMKIF